MVKSAEQFLFGFLPVAKRPSFGNNARTEKASSSNVCTPYFCRTVDTCTIIVSLCHCHLLTESVVCLRKLTGRIFLIQFPTRVDKLFQRIFVFFLLLTCSNINCLCIFYSFARNSCGIDRWNVTTIFVKERL